MGIFDWLDKLMGADKWVYVNEEDVKSKEKTLEPARICPEIKKPCIHRKCCYCIAISPYEYKCSKTGTIIRWKDGTWRF